jgi:hypothetical protein
VTEQDGWQGGADATVPPLVQPGALPVLWLTAARQQQDERTTPNLCRAPTTPSVRLVTVDEELGSLLGELRLLIEPTTIRRAIAVITASPGDDLEKRRRDLEHQRERLTKLYQWGDLSDE